MPKRVYEEAENENEPQAKRPRRGTCGRVKNISYIRDEQFSTGGSTPPILIPPTDAEAYYNHDREKQEIGLQAKVRAKPTKKVRPSSPNRSTPVKVIESRQ